MKRVALAVFSTIAGLVMLLGFKTHPAPSQAAIATGTGDGSPTAPDSSAGAASAGAASSGPSSSGPSSSASRTVTGQAIDTQYGPVQVRVSLKGSTIAAIDVLQYPSGHHEDAQINGYALPILNQEAMAAQSARIDAVSGATYTSDGYVRSLQSALDQAGIAS